MMADNDPEEEARARGGGVEEQEILASCFVNQQPRAQQQAQPSSSASADLTTNLSRYAVQLPASGLGQQPPAGVSVHQQPTMAAAAASMGQQPVFDGTGMGTIPAALLLRQQLGAFVDPTAAAGFLLSPSLQQQQDALMFRQQQLQRSRDLLRMQLEGNPMAQLHHAAGGGAIAAPFLGLIGSESGSDARQQLLFQQLNSQQQALLWNVRADDGLQQQPSSTLSAVPAAASAQSRLPPEGDCRDDEEAPPPPMATGTAEAQSDPKIVKIQKPKRPLSAYNLYFRDQRRSLLSEITGSGKVGFEDMAKMISAKWRSIDEETKAKYQAIADKEKARFQIDKEAYRKAMQQQLEASRQDLEATVNQHTRDEYLASGGKVAARQKKKKMKK